ncbi:MAG: 1,4-dihydroxy-6-naphthoate synthase [Ferruginibacter sp.]|nr:1,4-dihydroxy-6-naphthoate synthase [Ferruginibacter sp.]
MKFTLGFSPCPNDTFIFDALVHNKINTQGLTFDVQLEDVQTLNEWALQGKLQITKLSYGVLPLVLTKYSVLNSGSALGNGVGPLLIKNLELGIKNIEDFLIAIPGENTTAHLLFSLAYPNAKNKVFLRYDEIENFVLQNKGLGVIIHENRFTYKEKGLKKIIDLGDYWEQTIQCPIPLGGIVIKKDIDKNIAVKIDNLIKQSIEYAYKHHYNELTNYVKIHSQEMSEAVMKKHIDLYVNNYSLQLGQDGKNAIEKLIAVHEQITNTSINTSSIFL